ncbi:MULTISPECIES: WecB/TagA/CpsF family glycosyltransferase [Sphingomonas]|uniref:WecB/TagA/CpsF family glycosyltransferase n=1 Tax=Sphingomonas TaxID=13687 RepID=UPI001F07D246|nr:MULTISPECIES: WecB/TagA/CpsF family glycosyltransferase [Sphingomonas]
MEQVLARMAAVTSESPYGYVVTPNVDHVVQLDTAPDRLALRRVFAQATLSVCDSRVLNRLGRLRRVALPVVPGSDLTVRLFDETVQPGDLIAVVGGDSALVTELQRRFPQVLFAHHRPPMGLRHDGEARSVAAAFVARTKARFTLLAIGSPQQELVAAEVRNWPEAVGMALCIGASLEFITGRQRRAPKAMQRLSLEWAFRLFSNPRRLWRRYLVEGPHVFRMALRERRRG